jgi:hypothetical protein
MFKYPPVCHSVSSISDDTSESFPARVALLSRRRSVGLSAANSSAQTERFVISPGFWSTFGFHITLGRALRVASG